VDREIGGRARLSAVRWLLPTAAAAATLALAGCGGGGDDGSSPAASAAPNTQATNPATTATAGTTATADASATVADTAAAAAGPTNDELTGGAGADWPTPGGDLGNTRYSSLTAIDPSNVGRLHLVWQGSYGPTIAPANFNGGGPVEVEGAPLVYHGVMYLGTPQADLVAIDPTNGRELWRWRSDVRASDNITGITTAERGIAAGDGNVYIDNAAGKLVAVDARDGTLRWEAQVALPGTRLESPAVPVYYDGVVYTGVSGQEVARGHLDAFDARTGRRLWRSFVVCGPRDTPMGHVECPKRDAAANSGGGSVWTYPAIDPRAGLVYMTTANPSANTGIPGDDRWATSIVAMDMRTGDIRWGFQGVHHDLWDYDCLTPPVLFSNTFRGQQRDGVNYVCKSDGHFELDRTTGRPLLPVKEVPVPTAPGGRTPDPAAQKAAAASPTQPIPAGDSEVGDNQIVPHCATPELLPNPAPDGSRYVYSCTFAAPGSRAFIARGINSSGGQDDQPLSYNPDLGYMYYCEMVSVGAQKNGSRDQGGSFLGVDRGWVGSVAAVDVKTNDLVWRDRLPASYGNCRGGTATTASGLLFSSGNKGAISAYDARTGRRLWSYRAPQYIAAPPIVYEAGGREYVAYYVGGQVALLGGETAPHPDQLMVFSVDAPTTGSASRLPLYGGGRPSAAAGVNAGAGPDAMTVFRQNCSSCHTLAAAGATGHAGPNLDQLKPSAADVARQVTNGGGAMPAFGRTGVLNDAQIQAVAKFVAQVAGRDRH
jgi:outer membrane protein assembly factor BamB